MIRIEEAGEAAVSRPDTNGNRLLARVKRSGMWYVTEMKAIPVRSWTEALWKAIRTR